MLLSFSRSDCGDLGLRCPCDLIIFVIGPGGSQYQPGLSSGDLLQTLSLQILLEPLLDRVHELGRRHPGAAVFPSTTQREIFRHHGILVHRLNNSLF